MRRALLPLTLVAVAGLTGCSSNAVGVAVPAANRTVRGWCANLRLPATVQGLKKRSTNPESPQVAAWGSPAVALRCGVPRPSAALVSNQAQAVTLDGSLTWLPLESSKPVDFVAVGRQAYVEVTIPLQYTADHPAGDILLDLQPAIVRAIPARTDGLL
jgi:hypothetical protein